MDWGVTVNDIQKKSGIAKNAARSTDVFSSICLCARKLIQIGADFEV